MKIVQTADLTPESMEQMSATEKLWVYNALDCCVTLEVFDTFYPQMDETARATYTLSRALQRPILEMNMRGILVDQDERDQTIASFSKDIVRLEAQLDRLIRDGIGTRLNWRSPKQLMELLYDVMALPPIRKRNANGQMAPTVNREALERLDQYFIAQPIISHILALRDLGKKVGVLRTNIDADGRMRTSYNIAGTTTGRLSSSLSDFESGTNLQNIEQRLRRIFIADPGMKLANIDLEQADSRNVGAITWNLFRDPRYLDACESGDLHTTVAKMSWPNMPWTGDIRLDKEVAEQPFYRMYSYRYMAKRLGHGTNYVGTPQTMSKQTKVEQTVVSEFQKRYFAGFPSIPRWHGWVAGELLRTRSLTTLFGRRRHFFGRPDDPATIREAVAHMGQSMTADELSHGILAVWSLNICQFLLQVHDSLTIQYPEHLEDTIVPAVLRAIQITTPLAYGRDFTVPADCKVGWNWGDANEGNPDGLVKYKGGDQRTRQRKPGSSILDRRFC